jgi:hypothetical protein
MRHMPLRVAALVPVIAFGISGVGPLNAAIRTGHEAQPDIWFVNEGGGRQDNPLVDVTDAAPGTVVRIPLAIHIGGTSVAGYEVTVVASPSEALRLADVLVATVHREEHPRASYRGSLAALRLSGAGVAAGETVRYAVAVRWPDGGADDNQFQGRTQTFSVHARAWTSE